MYLVYDCLLCLHVWGSLLVCCNFCWYFLVYFFLQSTAICHGSCKWKHEIYFLTCDIEEILTSFFSFWLWCFFLFGSYFVGPFDVAFSYLIVSFYKLFILKISFNRSFWFSRSLFVGYRAYSNSILSKL